MHFDAPPTSDHCARSSGLNVVWSLKFEVSKVSEAFPKIQSDRIQSDRIAAASDSIDPFGRMQFAFMFAAQSAATIIRSSATRFNIDCVRVLLPH